MSVYQRAPGVWASSPQRKLLWAVSSVLYRLEKDLPEQGDVDAWAKQIEDELYAPVDEFDWEGWYEKHATEKRAPRYTFKGFTFGPFAGSRYRWAVKDDRPDLPPELEAVWDAIPEEIRDKLWPQAGEVRTSEEGLPFDPDDLAAGLDATFKDVKGVTDTTADALRRMMKLALDEGDGQFGFARTLRREFKAWSGKKAKQVALTEWNRAASTATLQGYRKMGVEQKRWFTLGDSRVCEICEQNAATGEVPINDAFWSGDDAPPAHPACRCSVSSA